MSNDLREPTPEQVQAAWSTAGAIVALVDQSASKQEFRESVRDWLAATFAEREAAAVAEERARGEARERVFLESDGARVAQVAAAESRALAAEEAYELVQQAHMQIGDRLRAAEGERDRLRDMAARVFVCGRCKAGPGSWCTGTGNKQVAGVHQERHTSLLAFLSASPPAPAQEAEPAHERALSRVLDAARVLQNGSTSDLPAARARLAEAIGELDRLVPVVVPAPSPPPGVIARVREMAPELKREHGVYFDRELAMSKAGDRSRGDQWCPAKFVAGAACRCGADDHNERVDELLRVLDEEAGKS